MNEERSLTIMVVPAGDGRTRTLRIPQRHVRKLAVLGLVGLLMAGALLASWGYLVARSWRVAQLESEVVELRAQQEQIGELARALAETEAAYERIRALFAPETLPDPGEGAAPPAAAGGAASDPSDDEMPTTWPLTEVGFLTQPLVEGGDATHPGIDVAVPAGSYIRAAGPGRVVEAAEDPVYGLYVILEHAGGYRTLYAHASRVMVETGDRIRRGEVLGLTGSTGRSTAPHLHFEILLDGSPVDPLSLVQRP